MLLDREVTPELSRELLKQQIVIARSQHEALVMGKVMATGLEVPALNASMDIDNILTAWKGLLTPWTILNGLSVLDLASGSADNHDMFTTRYPHFSRLCAINGADVVAIDANPQSGFDETMFSWAQADLVNAVLGEGLKSLPILQGREFDIIYSADFVGVNPCPELPRQLARHGIGRAEFEKAFLQQAGELLTEGGVMSLDDYDEKWLPNYYTRKGSDIVTLQQAA